MFNAGFFFFFSCCRCRCWALRVTIQLIILSKDPLDPSSFLVGKIYPLILPPPLSSTNQPYHIANKKPHYFQFFNILRKPEWRLTFIICHRHHHSSHNHHRCQTELKICFCSLPIISFLGRVFQQFLILDRVSNHFIYFAYKIPNHYVVLFLRIRFWENLIKFFFQFWKKFSFFFWKISWQWCGWCLWYR